MIRRIITVPFLIILVLCCLSTVTMAQDTLTYRGELRDASGAAVTASYGMTFTIYGTPDGDVSLWQERYDSVEILEGVFTVALGSQTPLPIELSRQNALFLGVAIGDGDELMPRTKISSALRAHFALHAQDVRGEDIHPSSISINEQEVIDERGRWVGDPSGLRGPEGPIGPQGNPGSDFDVNADFDVDGSPDWLEVMAGTDPLDSTSVPLDLDQDGVPDILRGPPGEPGPQGPAGNDATQGEVSVSWRQWKECSTQAGLVSLTAASNHWWS